MSDMVTASYVDPRDCPVKGQRWNWQGIPFTITRVSQRGRWADILVTGEGGWHKRQPLPLPVGSVLVGDA